MRVLMLGNHKSVRGGITSVVTQLVGHNWTDEGVSIHYIATYRGGNAANKIFTFIVAYLKVLIQMVFARPTIIYMHMSYKGSFHRKYLLHRLGKFFGTKTIVHLHGSEFKDWYDNTTLATQQKVRKLLKESDAFIVLGERWDKHIKSIEKSTKTYVISNTIPIPKDKVKAPTDKLTFLFMGVLIPRKGVADLIKAVHYLKMKKVDMTSVTFEIGGSGFEEVTLKRLVRDLDIEDEVQFLGWVDSANKKKVLTNAHVFILPSYNEGLPIAILESISFGMPVIATDVGDVSSAVIKRRNGFLYTPGNIEALGEEIEKFIQDNQRTMWHAMSLESRSIAENSFDEKIYFAKLADLFKAI